MKKVLVINNESLGNDDKVIGGKIMGPFLRQVMVHQAKPDVIILYNTAVKLACEGSTVLDAMDGLSNAGVDIISCVTCLNYFGLNDKVKAGRISGMPEIVDILMKAKKVISV